MAWPAVAGLVASLAGQYIGAAMSAKEQGKMKERLNRYANIPGVDIDAETLAAITGATENVPRAEALAQAYNAATQRQLAKVIPGYMNMMGAVGGNLVAALRGQLAPDTRRAVEGSAIAHATEGGYGGSKFARNLVARDIGRTSQDISMGATQMLPSWLSGMSSPFLNMVDWIGMTPAQRAVLTEQRQEAQRNALMQSVIPGGNAVWGSMLGQQGGMGAGISAQSLLSGTPKPSGSTGQPFSTNIGGGSLLGMIRW